MRCFLYMFILLLIMKYSTQRTCLTNEELKPVLSYINDTSVIISLPIIHSSTYVANIHRIEYWHINYLGCIKNEGDGTVIVREGNSTEVYVNYLTSFSHYGIKIFYTEGALLCIKETTFDTKESAVFNDEERPYIIPKFTATEAFVSIKWHCLYQRGRILLNIKINCASQPCDGDSIQYSKHETISTTDIRFNINQQTRYILKLNYHRGEASRFEEYTIVTNLQEPHTVMNIVAYNVSDDSVSLKWLPPYPPTGDVEYYEIIYYHDVDDKKKIKVDGSSNCNMWMVYICASINDSQFLNKTYNFEIRAKNRDINKFGNYNSINVTFNRGLVPSEPLNINYIWIDEWVAVIKWEHPDVSNGRIHQFNIHIYREISFIYNASKERLLYNYEVDLEKYNLTSNKLYIEIAAVNEMGISRRGAIPIKRPEYAYRPKLVTRNDIKVDILLPSVRSYGDIGKLYIIVSDFESPITDRYELHTEDRKIFDILGAKEENSWIIGEFDLKSATCVTIGDNSTSISTLRSSWAFFNRPLYSDHLYKVRLYLLDIYFGITSERSVYNSYSMIFTTSRSASEDTAQFGSHYSDDNFSYLWILLVLPALLSMVCVVTIKRRRNNSENFFCNKFFSSIYANLRESQINDADNIYEEIVLDDRSFTKLIKIRELDGYIKKNIENDEIERQYQMLPLGPIKLHSDGSQLPNRAKNRYPNLLAYDANRVKLKVIEGDEFSSYINANFIDGYNTRKAYIATQTPTNNTFSDFWRMIWQENIKYIIIASGITEEDKEKDSGIYWPDGSDDMDFDDIRVVYRNIKVMANYEIRQFSLFCEHQERAVEQLHFFNAPDYVRVSLYIQSLASFMKKILSISLDESPIVVHCSDGIGYTGVLILCDICLRMAISEGQVDIFFHLYKLRKQRINMVSSVEQYKVVHFVLLRVLDCLTIPTENGFICDKTVQSTIENILATKISQQMQYLEESSWQDEVIGDIDFHYDSIKFDGGFLNAEESPYSDIYRPTWIDDERLFIATTTVDSFSTPAKFIVAANPHITTLGVLWQLVCHKRINVILCLNKLFLIKDYETFNPLPTLEVTCADFEINQYFEVYTLHVNELINEENKIEVSIIHLLEWSSDVIHPERAESLIMAYEEMNRLGMAGGPVLVTCHDGIQASGLFVAMSFLIEKITMEHVCDVCLAVKSVRQSRKEYVKGIEQLRFLYLCALEYIRLFQSYSNFD